VVLLQDCGSSRLQGSLPRPELEGEIHLMRNSSNVLSFDIFKTADTKIDYADIWTTSMKDDPSG
jgi:hypothetical protein